jgi:translation initiation factor IF-1
MATVEAVVEEELPRGLYAVRTDDGRKLTASLPVTSRHGIVKLLRGDRVVIEPSLSDKSRARILTKL